MDDYPASIVPVNHVAPVPRRIRAYLGCEKVLDTTRALYVWEWPHYPQYYVPLDDVRRDVLVSEGHAQRTGRGLVELHGLKLKVQPGATGRGRPRDMLDSAIEGLKGTVRFEWAALGRLVRGGRAGVRAPAATRTRGSTRCARTAGCTSSSTGWCWPFGLPR